MAIKDQIIDKGTLTYKTASGKTINHILSGSGRPEFITSESRKAAMALGEKLLADNASKYKAVHDRTQRETFDGNDI